MAKTLRDRIRPGIQIDIVMEGKIWRCKTRLIQVTRSEAVGLIQGLLVDMQAEVEGEALHAMGHRSRPRPERREAA